MSYSNEMASPISRLWGNDVVVSSWHPKCPVPEMNLFELPRYQFDILGGNKVKSTEVIVKEITAGT